MLAVLEKSLHFLS